MEIWTIIILSFGLSMDAFAVSISNGICYKKINRKKTIIMAFTFGFFQALMPLIGYYLGTTFSSFINEIDHYIAFILLCIIGFNLIKDAIKELKNPHCCIIRENFTYKELLVQGIATSIDALAAGVTFAVVKTNIYVAVLFIGIITFILCSQGVTIGKKCGTLMKQKANIFGGIILIAIALKILIEHLFFH